MMKKMFENNYQINDKQYSFNLSEYLKNSIGISRDLMPQINYREFFDFYHLFDKHIKIMKILGPINILKPIQNEINLHRVLKRIQKNEVKEDKIDDSRPFFFCSNDFHIIDGHHRHVELLMTEPNSLADIYVFDLDAKELYTFFCNLKSFLKEFRTIRNHVMTNESHEFYNLDLKEFQKLVIEELLNESYGVQGPEAVPGIGDVSFGTPATANSQGTRGSGDIPTKSGRFFTSKELLKTQEKHNFITFDELKEIADKYRKKKDNKKILEEKEATEKNQILKKHFTKEMIKEMSDTLKPCINKKTKRKIRYFLEVDEEFSCETIEGIVQGKANDCLMVSDDGEIYPIDKEIFEDTYHRL